jgi:hypothetical protein
MVMIEYIFLFLVVLCQYDLLSPKKCPILIIEIHFLLIA